MATLDELKVVIKADASQLDRTMNRASSAVQQSAGKMSSAVGSLKAQFAGLVPALGAAAVISYTRSVVNAAAALQDLADRTGVSAGFLSGLKTELENAGGSVEGLAQAIFLMNNAIGEAARDAQGPVAESFKKLGLDLEGLKRLSPEQQFYLIADSVSKLGTEFEQTEAARNIFGRSVAGMLPLLKQGADGIKAVGDEAKKTGDALGNEQIAAVDRFGDAMNRMANTAGNTVVAAFAAAILKIEEFASWINKLRGDIGAMTRESLGGEIKSLEAQLARWEDASARPKDRMGNPINTGKLRSELDTMKAAYKANGYDRMDYEDKARAAGFATSATKVSGYSLKGGKLVKDAAPGKAGGTKELSAAEKELNRIRQEGERITDRNRTAYEKYALAVNDAQKALKAGAIDQTTFDRELIRLQGELAAATEDGMTKAAKATEDLTVNIRSGLASAFEDAVFDAKSAGNAISGILDGIARQIARKAVIDPLSSGLSDFIGSSFGGSGFGKMLGFADGGSPPVGVPSVVGERGPEIFVPRGAGTIIPNHALGGGGVSVTQNFNMSPGLQGTVEAEVRRAAPSIMAATKAAVFASIERGGPESRSVNRRS